MYVLYVRRHVRRTTRVQIRIRTNNTIRFDFISLSPTIFFSARAYGLVQGRCTKCQVFFYFPRWGKTRVGRKCENKSVTRGRQSATHLTPFLGHIIILYNIRHVSRWRFGSNGLLNGSKPLKIDSQMFRSQFVDFRTPDRTVLV